MEGLMSTLMNALASAAWAELGLAWGVDGDIRTLQRRMSTIDAVLRDAEARAITDGALRKWLADLKGVAFDAEDVLDEVQTEAALRAGKKEKVLCCLSPYFSTLLFRNKTARKIKHIVLRFGEVAEERRNFHLAEGAAAEIHPEREEFAFQVKDAEIFGRDDDKDQVIEWLTQFHDDGRDVSVLPIVGLGGLGKTTLARMVYNDERTLKHFETRIWVFVGKNFDLRAIAKAMLERDSEAQSVSTLDGLHRLIRERVTNKRYLLILDDVWSEDRFKWEKLEDMLSGSAHGSKVVVTTRSHEVAMIVGTAGCAHRLKGLTDDDCWMLFKQRAFGQGSVAESANLVNIGKEIVQRCKGLPLAAKSLGSLMATKQQEGQWLAIRNSETWNLDGCAEGILPALQLSYDHLSPQLKRCFTYCSVFPKDYEIKKLRLIQLWIAQGFIQSKGGVNLEDIGTQYFNTLLNSSFFQDECKDEYGNIESCKMHDLVHDLACFVAKDESSIVQVDEKIILPQGCRYSSILYHEESSIVEIASEANKVRSFFLLFDSVHGHSKAYVDFDDLKFSNEISNLTRLRALHIDCKTKGDIVRVLRKLKHLRFLELSRLKAEALPDSITDLCNLQTLNLGECEKLKELPKGMMMMSNLRHLMMKECRVLAGMPRGIGKLTHLQTLSLFKVGKEESHANISELRHLNQIKGELFIRGLDNVKDPKDAKEASLSSKAGLVSLKLKWYGGSEASTPTPTLSNDVLENLQPHINLKRLVITNYKGSRVSSWFTNLASSSLPNLACLRLEDLPNCENLPSLGLLPSLKELYLFDVHALKKVGKELYGESSAASAAPSFPSLKILYLEGARELEEWSVPERGAFPSLEKLDFSTCPKLKILGSMPTLCMSNQESGREMELDVQQNQPPPSFISLYSLRIQYCGALAALPEWLRGAVSLESMLINQCTSLQMLPDGIQHLSCLRELTVGYCPDLQMLPDGIQHLSRLETLGIVACPQLKRRCKRETGEDWHKISHIPTLHIFN